VPNYSVRPAHESDCAEIARLSGQLGYPAAADTMRGRLQRLIASAQDAVFVAESADGGLIGWVQGALSQYLESDYRVVIAGLIVEEPHQRRGVGRALVQQVEHWAAEHGVKQTVVRCQTKREGAHRFYESLGYRPSKTQIVFRKALES
jgi:GNAT superfamily N-acetyltransferase